ncbi:HNH endonuclease signature motif containing protein [Streptomyces sp. DH1]|uniref:HNH endonuclease signature motif containing protein n=1 Tax=Streptomyces sp. DH1 TaxID=2857012 RepID=UPI001E474DC3|nr:HNH endonuclease signature motif containing protein [Streptomyces sp. DH1]
MPTLQLALTDEELARFLEKIDPPNLDGCTLWNASTFGGGYGQFKIRGRSVLAHRVAWTLRHGPIPEGMEIDHVWARGCRSRRCVNTDHLEPVTTEENARRREAALRWRLGIWVRTELDED